MAVIYGDELANDLSGTAGADSIYGMSGNDTLSGQTGDSLYGGNGDDEFHVTYVVGNFNSAASISEDVSQGHDSVYLSLSGLSGSVSYFLPKSVEDLYIYSGDALGGGATLNGNVEDNLIDASNFSGSTTYGVYIMGKKGDDVVFGSSLDDAIDGGEGVDGMAGGKGDDQYYVDNSNDVIVENSNGGYDWVWCYTNGYRLASNVEELDLVGDVRQVLAYGNGLNNIIESQGDYSRIINAGRGDDVVISDGNAADVFNGGAGNDYLRAGLGDDIYRAWGDFGYDEIADIGGDDAVEFEVAKERLWLARSGDDLKISVIGAQSGVTVKNWYSDPSARVEEFYAGDGKMLPSTKVDQLVSAMSAFIQPTTSVMPATVQTALAPTLAAVWQ